MSRRAAAWLFAALACFLGASEAGAGAKDDAIPGFIPFAQGNTADLPGRCDGEHTFLGMESGTYKMHSQFPSSPQELELAGRLPNFSTDPDMQPIGVLLEISNPDSPTVANYMAKKLDWFNRRETVEKKIETALAGLPRAGRLQGLHNYAYALLYIGEFKKIISYFGPGGAGSLPSDGIITFIRAQALWHMGRYRESLPLAKKALKLLPDKILDTRWQLMLTEMGLYGPEYFRKYSKNLYTTKHVADIFSNLTAAGLPFEDVTDTMSIERWSGTGSVSFADLNGDGWDELLIQRKQFPSKIYKNDHGRFVPVPDANIEGPPQCFDILETVADYDNDGKPDLQRHCCNYDGPGHSVLYKNMGDLKFKDVTKQSGLDYHIAGMHTSWGDYDLDGNLDFIATDQLGPSRLFHNNGDGTFTDVTEKAGFITPGGAGPELWGAVGCAFGDYDGDGYPDISCNGWGWSRLFHNNRDGTFTDVTVKAGIDVGKEVKGYNALWGDFDNQGRLDLYVGRYVTSSSDLYGYGPRCTCSNLLGPEGYSQREWNNAGTIYRNNGDGTFTDMRATTHFIPLGVMGVNAADWNNDGRLHIVMGAGGPYMQQLEPYLFYENQGGYKFKLLTPFLDGSLWGKGHGAAFGDYDHDGNLDLFLNNGGAFPGDIYPSKLLHNKGNSNHWLGVSLKGGPGTNSMAVGAQAQIFAGDLHHLEELAVGGRFTATNSFMIHFGLGPHATVDRLVIRWPNKSGHVTELKDIPADQAIEVDEASGQWKTLWAAPRPVGTKP
jgi:tetratricopeptide (TPR) repeat protein